MYGKNETEEIVDYLSNRISTLTKANKAVSNWATRSI
jgi:hypothetical protein